MSAGSHVSRSLCAPDPMDSGPPRPQRLRTPETPCSLHAVPPGPCMSGSLCPLHPRDSGPPGPRVPLTPCAADSAPPGPRAPWAPSPRTPHPPIATSLGPAPPRPRDPRPPARPPQAPPPPGPGAASQVSWIFASRDARAGAGPRPRGAANGRPGGAGAAANRGRLDSSPVLTDLRRAGRWVGIKRAPRRRGARPLPASLPLRRRHRYRRRKQRQRGAGGASGAVRARCGRRAAGREAAPGGARHALERPVGRRPRRPVPEAVQEVLLRLLPGGEGPAARLVPGGHAHHGGLPLGGRGQGERVLALGGPALRPGARPPALCPAPADQVPPERPGRAWPELQLLPVLGPAPGHGRPLQPRPRPLPNPQGHPGLPAGRQSRPPGPPGLQPRGGRQDGLARGLRTGAARVPAAAAWARRVALPAGRRRQHPPRHLAAADLPRASSQRARQAPLPRLPLLLRASGPPVRHETAAAGQPAAVAGPPGGEQVPVPGGLRSPGAVRHSHACLDRDHSTGAFPRGSGQSASASLSQAFGLETGELEGRHESLLLT